MILYNFMVPFLSHFAAFPIFLKMFWHEFLYWEQDFFPVCDSPLVSYFLCILNSSAYMYVRYVPVEMIPWNP